MLLWFGPFESTIDDGINVRRPPVGAAGAIDLSGRGDGRNVGVFATPEQATLGAGYLPMGRPDEAMSATVRLAFSSALGHIASPLSAITPAGAIWEALSVKSDPTGDRVRPLMPSRYGRLNLWIAGVRILHKRFRLQDSSAEKANILDQLQRIYAAKRLAGGLHYRKWLGFQVRKLGLSGDEYRWIQGSLPDETPLPPETVISDDFNRADESLDAGDWTELSGNWSVASNGVRKETDGNTVQFARRTDSLSGDDQYAQVKLIGGSSNTGHGPAVRLDASENAYGVYHYSTALRLARWDAATSTQLAQKPRTFSTGETYKVQADGSDISGWVDGGLQVTATDTTYTGTSTPGLQCFDNQGAGAPVLDDFQAADLVSGAGSRAAQHMKLGIFV